MKAYMAQPEQARPSCGIGGMFSSAAVVAVAAVVGHARPSSSKEDLHGLAAVVAAVVGACTV